MHPAYYLSHCHDVWPFGRPTRPRFFAKCIAYVIFIKVACMKFLHMTAHLIAEVCNWEGFFFKAPLKVFHILVLCRQYSSSFWKFSCLGRHFELFLCSIAEDCLVECYWLNSSSSWLRPGRTDCWECMHKVACELFPVVRQLWELCHINGQWTLGVSHIETFREP